DAVWRTLAKFHVRQWIQGGGGCGKAFRSDHERECLEGRQPRTGSGSTPWRTQSENRSQHQKEEFPDDGKFPKI
ncbi:MAG TPA: hypothetical protein DCY13_01215, partial [Verrucomicrobiales bacterium]|nr:hypothetical protein [Verrucomicrobiales bacterium]